MELLIDRMDALFVMAVGTACALAAAIAYFTSLHGSLQKQLSQNYQLVCETMESVHREEEELIIKRIDSAVDDMDEAIERRLLSIEHYALEARATAMAAEKLSTHSLATTSDVKSTIEGMKNSTHKVEYIPMDVAKAMEEANAPSIAGEMLSKLDEAIQRGSNINADFGEI